METLGKGDKRNLEANSKKKLVLFFVYGFLSILLPVLLFSLPLYEVNVNEYGTYQNFYAAFSLLAVPENWIFLVFVIGCSLALLVAAVFYCLCVKAELADKPDESDSRFMTAMIIFSVSNTMLGFFAFGLGLWICMITGLVLAIASFAALYYYFKHLALLADNA